MKRISGRHIYLNPAKALMTAFVILILFRIPRSFLGIPYLYSIRYMMRSLGDEYQVFGITFVELVAIAIGLILYTQRRNEKTRYLLLLAVVALINIGRFLFGLSNPFEYNSYEIFLTLLVAFSCGTMIEHYYRTSNQIEVVLDLIITLFFIFQMYYVVIGKKGGTGSYGTVGISSGGLALCYATYVLLKLLNNEHGVRSIALIAVSIVGLVLTGSRTQLLLLFGFLVIYVGFYLSITNGRKWMIIGIGTLALVALLMSQDTIAILANNRKIQSIMKIFSTGLYSYITGDASALERFKTWTVGFGIIQENPLGISCSFMDLQTRMFRGGSPTFPHSFLLAYYLLLGLPAIVIYFQWWKVTIKTKKMDIGITLVLIYILLLLTFYGGVITEYLMAFWLFLVYSYTTKRITEKELENSKEEYGDNYESGI